VARVVPREGGVTLKGTRVNRSREQTLTPRVKERDSETLLEKDVKSYRREKAWGKEIRAAGEQLSQACQGRSARVNKETPENRLNNQL